MSKIKINPGLASVILLASLFAGWGTLLIVAAIMLVFCEVDDKVKGIAVKVIAFFAALTLVSLGWSLIVDGVGVVIDLINKLVATINCYLDPVDYINISKLNSYLLTPIQNIVSMADSVISFLLQFAKFAFIIATLANKEMKDNFVVKKINEFVAKVVYFVNQIDVPTKEKKSE